MSSDSNTRHYRKRKRAVQEEETRLRITEALVALHCTIGPAGVSVTEVAKRAGVSRMTVYNHFPTVADQFQACSTHWFARNPPPDLATWEAEADPRRRLRTGLAALYGWYRRTQDMMENVLRDAATVPEVSAILDARWWPFIDRAVDVLSEDWPEEEGIARRAALRLTVDFGTWQVLVASGLDDARSARLASRMVECGPVGVSTARGAIYESSRNG